MSSVKIEKFCLPVGLNPKRDNGGPRPWQREAIELINDEKKQALIIGPTGSGKSPVIKARGAIRLALNSNLKHIVIVPQSVIASSFGKLNVGISWPGVGKLDWLPAQNLIDIIETIDQLINFISGSTKNALYERILVCTHQAFVVAFKKLKESDNLSLLNNVFLTIDEVHHSSAPEEDECTNGLGDIVKYYFENDLYLDMFTATWMRSNHFDIIPSKYQPNIDYAKYVLFADRHLESMNYLREISIRFLIGTPEDCIKQLYKEGSEKTIVYLPPVNSNIMKNGYDDKYYMRGSLAESLGFVKPSDDGITEIIRIKRKNIYSIDLITEVGRDQRQRELINRIKNNKTPDIIWALNMCKEGFDCPEVSRGFVIGPRGSMVDVIQTLGRLLRDYPGKTKAEFNIVLPFLNKDEDPYKIRDYLKIMLSTLIIEWQFRRPKLCDQTKKVINKVFSENPEIGEQILSVSINAAINANNIDSSLKVIRDAIDSVDGIDSEEKSIIAPQIVRMLSGSLMDVDDIPFDDMRLVKDDFGKIRSYAFNFGYETLFKLREALGRSCNLTKDTAFEVMWKYYKLNNRWPTAITKDPVIDNIMPSWNSLDAALVRKFDSSIAKLLAERGVLNAISMISLTKDLIINAAKKYYEKEGKWPRATVKGVVPELPGYTWKAIDHALHSGYHGLNTNGSSLFRFLKKEGLVKIVNRKLLTEELINNAAKKYYDRTGKLPTKYLKSSILELPDFTWKSIDLALKKGHLGIKNKGSSLAKLLASNGFINTLNKKKLSEKQIMNAVKKFLKKTNKRPRATTKGSVPGFPGYTWSSIDKALRNGHRGLNGGSSLTLINKFI